MPACAFSRNSCERSGQMCDVLAHTKTIHWNYHARRALSNVSMKLAA